MILAAAIMVLVGGLELIGRIDTARALADQENRHWTVSALSWVLSIVDLPKALAWVFLVSGLLLVVVALVRLSRLRPTVGAPQSTPPAATTPVSRPVAPPSDATLSEAAFPVMWKQTNELRLDIAMENRTGDTVDGIRLELIGLERRAVDLDPPKWVMADTGWYATDRHGARSFIAIDLNVDQTTLVHEAGTVAAFLSLDSRALRHSGLVGKAPGPSHQRVVRHARQLGVWRAMLRCSVKGHGSRDITLCFEWTDKKDGAKPCECPATPSARSGATG